MTNDVYLFDRHVETPLLSRSSSVRFVAFVKRDCPTCELIADVLVELSKRSDFLLISQDDPHFPTGATTEFDEGLEASFHHDVETVPTLIVSEDGIEIDRLVGWSKIAWQRALHDPDLGGDLIDTRPGCGSLSADFNFADQLAVSHSAQPLHSRRIEISSLTDEAESAFDRGWTDGLPVVTPTPVRVHRMLAGSRLDPQTVIAHIPPNLTAATVEKIAINSVLAGAKPEYLPVIIAAVKGFCSDQFNGHGLLATTYPAGPVVIVNGPIATRIGMNSSVNALGQGNRANATIGRALQLIVRNLGGGIPGGVDRAALGGPGKYTFCFSESEVASPWGPLSEEFGIPSGSSSVTLFAGEGPRVVVDQISRTPQSLAATFAATLRTVAHPKLAIAFDALMVVCPEHARVFRDANWSKERLRDEVNSRLMLDADEMRRGADGIEEGLRLPPSSGPIPKFRPGMPLFTYAGGGAGMFSAIIGGWVSGSGGSSPISIEIDE